MAVDAGLNGRVVMRDVTVDITPNSAGANAIQAVGERGRVDLANVRVLGDMGGSAVAAARMKAANVDVSGTSAGISVGGNLKGSDITANDTDNFGVFAKRARIERLEAHGNALAGFGGGRVNTLGNLAENERAFLFFMDYERRRRLKAWGRTRVVEGDADLLARLTPEGYAARAERAIVFHVEAWDVNCPKRIPQKLDAVAVKAARGGTGEPHPCAGGREP